MSTAKAPAAHSGRICKKHLSRYTHDLLIIKEIKSPPDVLVVFLTASEV